jgi:hypothetical protein
MAEKWVNVLPTTFTPNWMEIWNLWRLKKEAGFIWSIYHGAWQQMSGELEPQRLSTLHACVAPLPYKKLYCTASIIAPRRLMHSNMQKLSYLDMWIFTLIELANGPISHGNNA